MTIVHLKPDSKIANSELKKGSILEIDAFIVGKDLREGISMAQIEDFDLGPVNSDPKSREPQTQI
jgi:hypothetical protein